MSNPEAERRDYLFEHGDDRREERRKGDRRDGYGKNRYDERQDNGRDQHGKNRRNDRYGKGDKLPISETRGRHTVATMISAAAGTMRAVISNGPIPAISSVRASLAAMNAATRITASPMTSAPMTAADSPCATPVRAKAASASIARTRTASYATSVQKVPSVTNAA